MLPQLVRVCLIGLVGAGSIFAQPPPIQQVPQVQLPNLNALPLPPMRVPIYYPPAPPVPGAEIDPVSPLMAPNWDAPEGLGDFVGELIYPVVGSRLAEKDLPRRVRSRLDAYRARREELVSAVRVAWTSGAPLPESHARAVQALEAEAEELRAELPGEDYHWSAYRNWALGPARNGDDPVKRRVHSFQLLRAAAFYHSGLSVGQRWLLWDYVLRLEESGLAEIVEVPVVRAGGTLPFLPAGAHIRLPWTLPGSLVEKLRIFGEGKLRLQRALAQTMMDVDVETGGTRRKRIEELERMQAEPIAELERLAESIRVELAALPPEEPLVLPPELDAQARAFRRKREAVHADLAARLRATRSEVLRYRPGSERLMWESNFKSGAFVPVTSIGPMTQLMAQIIETPRQQGRAERAGAKLDEAVAAFARETETRRKAVEAEGQALFATAVRTILPDHPEGEPLAAEWEGKVLSILGLAAIAERLPRYESYLAATVRPGLDPAQRRMMFGAALRELQLPLPAGVRRPFNELSSP